MRLDLPRMIDKKQWLARLGVRGEADEQLQQQMQSAEAKLLEAAVPQGIYRIMGTDAFELPGNAIKKHLEECTDMVVMAVTLGAGVDRLIRISQVRDMAEAVLLDSGASVLAEQCADILEAESRTEAGSFMTGRYSPGYGDFPIEMQKQLIKTVDGPKNIGLTTNESCILIPRKSITAIMGIADNPVTGYLATCDECTIRETCRLCAEGAPCYK